MKPAKKKVWLDKLTALDMTPLGWLGRKTATQTKNKLYIEALERRWTEHVFADLDICCSIMLLCPFVCGQDYLSKSGK